MKSKSIFRAAIIATAVILPVTVISQGQNQSFVVSGHSGSLRVTQINGRNYIEVEALAQLLQGSLAFDGSQIRLTLGVDGNDTPPGGDGSHPTGSAFSPSFVRAGIEAMSSIREWHAALASAIQNQLPVAQQWLAPYQAQAMTNVRLAKTEAVSDADQNAMRFIANVFQKMKQLSDKYVAQRADRSYIAPDALSADPADQSIIACGKALGAMAANGQFVDDAACH